MESALRKKTMDFMKQGEDNFRGISFPDWLRLALSVRLLRFDTGHSLTLDAVRVHAHPQESVPSRRRSPQASVDFQPFP